MENVFLLAHPALGDPVTLTALWVFVDSLNVNEQTVSRIINKSILCAGFMWPTHFLGGYGWLLYSAGLIIKKEMLMDLMQFVITLTIIGVLLWFVNTYIPMDRKVKQILNIVAMASIIIWVGNLFGVFDSVRGIHIGK